MCTTGWPWAAPWSTSPTSSRTRCSSGFGVVLSYDLGNGLNIERGGELVDKWQGAELKKMAREPLPAIQWIGRYLRYLGNLRTLGTRRRRRTWPSSCAAWITSFPADGTGFEHGSITSQLRAWAGESPFTDLAFTSLLIADNLNDVEPLIAASPQTTRVRVPLPDAEGARSRARRFSRSNRRAPSPPMRSRTSSRARSPASRSPASKAW